ncbi:MAG TPA: hypothetical protein VF516_23090 [Kofleriaceae bacterium]
MRSNDWFSSITTNTFVIGEYGASFVIPPVHPPESRATSKVVVSTDRVMVLPASPCCSWHSFQYGTIAVPLVMYCPGVDPPLTLSITDQ